MNSTEQKQDNEIIYLYFLLTPKKFKMYKQISRHENINYEDYICILEQIVSEIIVYGGMIKC